MSTKTLKARGNELADSTTQRLILEREEKDIPHFDEKLRDSGLFPLCPASPEILQINLGKVCNQTCEHCHVDAGPDRRESMSRETMQQCLELAASLPGLHTIDLTGGAPEMHPDFEWLIAQAVKLNKEVIVRSNLTILESNKKYAEYPRLFADHGITVIASLPCYTENNTDRQRGEGVFTRSIAAIRRLNEAGYGREGSPLLLHLVYNPGGTGIPGPQHKLEEDYKRVLKEQYGISFNHLYTLTNLPISRFLDYLLNTDQYEAYMEKLVNAFNPAAVNGLMCRNTISVSWDGFLFDCDFNQMLQTAVQKPAASHIRDWDQMLWTERAISTGRHCFGCTAGAGSSCQGAIL